MEKYLCKKTVRMEPSNLIGFTEGKIYQRTNPEVWPPDHSLKHCLVDNMGSDHFFDRHFFNEHFERVGVVENFAHEPTKEPHTEALNKHNVSGRSELLLAFAEFLLNHSYVRGRYYPQTLVKLFEASNSR